jgi:hypothetical protein
MRVVLTTGLHLRRKARTPGFSPIKRGETASHKSSPSNARPMSSARQNLAGPEVNPRRSATGRFRRIQSRPKRGSMARTKAAGQLQVRVFRAVGRRRRRGGIRPQQGVFAALPRAVAPELCMTARSCTRRRRLQLDHLPLSAPPLPLPRQRLIWDAPVVTVRVTCGYLSTAPHALSKIGLL